MSRITRTALSLAALATLVYTIGAPLYQGG
jgi:hypothetical protein